MEKYREGQCAREREGVEKGNGVGAEDEGDLEEGTRNRIKVERADESTDRSDRKRTGTHRQGNEHLREREIVQEQPALIPAELRL